MKFLQLCTLDILEYKEIDDTLNNSKLFNLITLISKTFKKNKLEKKEYMELLEHLFNFLKDKISKSIVDEIKYDSELMRKLIYNIFCFNIDSEKCEEENIRKLYEEFTSLIDKKIHFINNEFSNAKKSDQKKK